MQQKQNDLKRLMSFQGVFDVHQFSIYPSKVGIYPKVKTGAC